LGVVEEAVEEFDTFGLTVILGVLALGEHDGVELGVGGEVSEHAVVFLAESAHVGAFGVGR